MFCDTFVVYCCILTCKVKLTFYRPIVENMLGVKVQPKGKEFELTLQLKKSASKPEQNSQLRKTIAVLTSGGDSQGWLTEKYPASYTQQTPHSELEEVNLPPPIS
uniref:Uncharacterized protein n=1 Tax=Timema cristinae TaxID=61476 RepID=A0A7R9GWT2_TIMCR|nr:unnamed protein product [Timema cristinae]